MSHIFISYSRKDIDFAQKIVDALAANDLDTWIDWKSIPKGEDWEQEIYHGIEGADAFLFLVSPDSVTSEMCNKEIAHAVTNGKRILPIFISNTEVDFVLEKFLYEKQREEISRRNFIFCRDGQDDFEKAIAKTRETIRTDYDWLKYHTRLQVEALEWERTQDSSRLLMGQELLDSERYLLRGESRLEPILTNLQKTFISKSKGRANIINKINWGINLESANGISFTEYGLSAIEANTLSSDIQSNQAMMKYLDISGFPVHKFQHTGSVTSIDISADGRVLLVGDSDGFAKIWDIENGNIVSAMRHQNKVNSVTFSPNKSWVASGSSDGIIKVWDWVSGEEISSLSHEDQIASVVFGSSGNTIASGSTDGSIKIWDPGTGKIILSLSTGVITSNILFFPSGEKLIFGTAPPSARVIDNVNGKELINIPHTQPVSAVAISKNGDLIASGDYQGVVKVWNGTTGEIISTINQVEWISSVAFSPDEKWIACSSTDGIRLWEVATGREIFRIKKNMLVSSLDISEDGQLIVFGGRDGMARVWSIEKESELAVLPHDASITNVLFAPDGKTVISGDENGVIQIWKTSSAQKIMYQFPGAGGYSPKGKYLLSRINDNKSLAIWDVFKENLLSIVHHDDFISSWIFSPGDHLVASGGRDKIVKIWKAIDGSEMLVIKFGENVSSLRFSPDEHLIIVGGDKGTIAVWDIKNNQELAHTKLSQNLSVSSIVFNTENKKILGRGGEHIVWEWEWEKSHVYFSYKSYSDRIVEINIAKNILVTISRDYVVTLWNITSGEEIHRISHGNLVRSIDFSINGNLFASGSWDRTVKILDLSTGDEIEVIQDEDQITSVNFCPTGEHIVITNDSGKSRVWNLKTEENVAMRLFNGWSLLSSFSSDGNWVISRGGNNEDVNTWIWCWRNEDLVTQMYNQVVRNFTRAEWQQYFLDEPYHATCPNLPIPEE